jgi:hypothetical protein
MVTQMRDLVETAGNTVAVDTLDAVITKLSTMDKLKGLRYMCKKFIENSELFTQTDEEFERYIDESKKEIAHEFGDYAMRGLIRYDVKDLTYPVSGKTVSGEIEILVPEEKELSL